jgi:hypothetical protein
MDASEVGRMPYPRGATLRCINGHHLSASWAVPAARPKRGEKPPPVRAIRTECPVCGNKLDVFIDGRADPRTFHIRPDVS